MKGYLRADERQEPVPLGNYPEPIRREVRDGRLSPYNAMIYGRYCANNYVMQQDGLMGLAWATRMLSREEWAHRRALWTEAREQQIQVNRDLMNRGRR